MNTRQTIFSMAAAIALAAVAVRARAADIILSDLNVGNGQTYTVGAGDTLTVGSGTANYVGVADGGGWTGTLDVSAATSFTANVGNFKVASGSVGSVGTARLGVNNTITASTLFAVGASGWDFTTGTATTAAGGITTIHTPLFRLGWAVANGTSGGTGRFTLGSGASLIVDGISGGRTELAIGYDEEQYGRPSNGTMDLSGGVANLTLSSLSLGGQLGNGNTPGTLTFSSNAANRLDVSGTGNVVKVGFFGKWYGNDGGSGTGTLDIGNLGSNSAITSTDNGTAILIGSKEAGSGGSATGTVNLGGGTLTITTTGIGGGGGTSTLSLDGTVLVAGASSAAWIAGLSTAKVRSGGVTFNTNGADIGVPQALLADATSTGGGLTKAGSGTLTLSGTNTFTGPTSITGGRLVVSSSSRLLSSSVTIGSGAELSFRSSTALGTAPVFTGTGATLDASGTMNGSLSVTSNNTLAVGSTPLTVTGLTLADNTTVRVESGGTSRVQINGDYTDSLGPHTLVTGFAASGTPYTFLSWTGNSGSLTSGLQSNWGVQEGDTGTKSWTQASSGSWNTPSAWDAFVGGVTADTTAKTLAYSLTYVTSGTKAPTSGNDVVVDPAAAGVTVTGPVPSATVRSLQVGGTNATSPTLALSSGNLTASQSVTVTGNGTLDASTGGLITPTLAVNSAGATATLANAATVVTTANVSGGRLTADAGTVSTVNLTGSGTLAGNLAVPQVNVTAGTPAFSGRATTMTVSGGGVTTSGGEITAFRHNAGAGTSTIGASTAVTDARVAAGTVNYNSTLASGSLALPAGSTGTVVFGSGARVTSADFSAGVGTANATNAVGVTNQIKLAGGVTAALSFASSFTVSGANLADATAPRTLTLSGGMVTLTPPQAGLPVIGSGPTIWFDAAQADTLFTDSAGTTQVSANGESVARWNSRVGGYYMAQSDASSRPTIAMNQAAGNPVVTFGPLKDQSGPGEFMSLYGSDGNPLRLNVGDTANTVFWIVQGSNFLLGDSDYYNFHRGQLTPTGNIWDSTWASDAIKNGATYLNKTQVNGTQVGLTGTGTFDLVDLVTTGGGAAYFNALARDRVYRYGGMQHGELIVFPGALSTADRQEVENYLYSKWITGGGSSGPTTLDTTSIAIESDSVLDLGSGTSAHTLGNVSIASGRLAFQASAAVSVDTISSPGSGSIYAVVPISLRSGTVSVAAGQTLTMDASLANGTQATSLVKAGAGKLALTGANTFTGQTTVREGVLSVGSGATLATGSMVIDGGTLRYNATTALSAPVTFTAGAVGGTNLLGSLDGLTIGSGRAISPGNSPGTATTGAQTWAAGGTYVWEMNDATGSAGGASGWDLLAGNDTLSITSGSASPFTIAITSLSLANVSGTAANFDSLADGSWLIADFANPVVGFSPSNFRIDTTGFLNPFGGSFNVALGNSGLIGGDDSQVYVTYTWVPEPRAIVLGGLGLLGLLACRRRTPRRARPRDG